MCQPFFHVPRNPNDPRVRADISSGSASLTASQLFEQEALSQKNAAVASNALSMAEYIHNYPGMPEGAKAVLHHLKLRVACCNFSWREMLLRRSIALDCLRKTLPPIDEDQRLTLLHAPFKGTTLFRGEMAKLQEANTKRTATFAVFPTPTAPPVSYSSRPYVGRGNSFSDRKGPKKPSGRGKGQGRPLSTTTITRHGQPKEGQPSRTASTSRTPINVRLSPGTTPLKPPPPERTNITFEGKVKVKSNEGVLPPQLAAVGGRLSELVEGWKRITNDPYVLSIVAKGYRLRLTSPPLLRETSWEIRSSQGREEILGMREQISLMLQKNAITKVLPNSPGFYSNVVIDLKSLNAHISAPHFHMSTSGSVLSTMRKGDYAFKKHLQDAYFHTPIHPGSRKYLRFAFENKVYQFRVLPFGLNRAPQVFTRLGHMVAGYLYLGISVVPYLDDWLIHHPEPSSLATTCTSGPAFRNTGPSRFSANEKKSELDLVQDIQFLGIQLRLDLRVVWSQDPKLRR